MASLFIRTSLRRGFNANMRSKSMRRLMTAYHRPSTVPSCQVPISHTFGGAGQSPLRKSPVASGHAQYSTATATPIVEPDFLADEPPKPRVRTQVPGPKSTKAIKELNKVFDTRSVDLVCDYKSSVGNYLCDMDANIFLDVYAQIASIPLGYSNPHLIHAAVSPDMANALVNRPALGKYPPGDFVDTLKAGMLRVAPKGLNQVFTAMAGSDANETAFKAAFMYHARMKRGEGVRFTEEELKSCMENKPPGSPEMSILSFKNGFHGRLFASLSTTRSKPIHKMDIPAFNWPQAPFPALKYPLEEHATENEAEEKKCLEELESIIQSWPNPIAAVIVEPIQSEGGDNHASSSFFREVREITKKHNVLLIVDEVQTGIGVTGKFWAHEHWQLTTPPDMVTFSKKAQAAGYYFGNPLLRPDQPYRQFNTWMGDPARAILFNAIISEIDRFRLVQHTGEVGKYLYNALEDLAKKYPERMQNLRGKGRGTFIAWDAKSKGGRDEFLGAMKYAGVNIGGSGERAVRLRPMLIFQRRHADVLVRAVEQVLSGEVTGKFKTKAGEPKKEQVKEEQVKEEQVKEEQAEEEQAEEGQAEEEQAEGEQAKEEQNETAETESSAAEEKKE